MGTVAAAQSNEAANYQLTVDGKVLDVALGKEYQMKLANGKVVTVAVKQKDVLTYKDDWISLQYPSGLHPAFTSPDPDIEQMMLVTANGNGVLVQKYKTLDPSSLVSLMLKEVTDEDVSFGYKMEEKPFEHKLVSGQKAVGKTVKLTYGNDVQHYTVAALGGKDQGILFITMLNTEYNTGDDKVIQLFLDTFSYKL
ncbi:hypothetical protein GCM10007389_16040 [Pontibacter akesuensis]|nr:hypothetical protein GCM10007389_16040 [Pontibacter akesuensis]